LCSNLALFLLYQNNFRVIFEAFFIGVKNLNFSDKFLDEKFELVKGCNKLFFPSKKCKKNPQGKPHEVPQAPQIKLLRNMSHV
jgi:hypothetical protein